jgi:hypothetical protein
MTENPPPTHHNRPNHGELHPRVYCSIVGLTIWLVLSIWALFSRGAYVGLILAVITLFFLVAVGIPTLIWLAWRHNAESNAQHDYIASFSEWAMHPFATRTGGILGREAAIQILLPIAAVAFGMTLFGLAFLFAVPHLSS